MATWTEVTEKLDLKQNQTQRTKLNFDQIQKIQFVIWPIYFLRVYSITADLYEIEIEKRNEKFT